MTYLNLGRNYLVGAFPASLLKLTKLSFLNLDSNFQTNGIENLADIAVLTELTYLNLRSTALVGPVPTGVTNLAKLSYLNLGRNGLTGMVSNDYAALAPTLTFLSFFSNKGIEGTFDVYCQMTSLQVLYLGSTSMSGKLPDCLATMTNLKELDVSDAYFSGLLPTEIGGMKSLEVLYLSDWADSNTFVGPLPDSFGQLLSLQQLWMQVSTLDGPLPTLNFYLPRGCKLEIDAVPQIEVCIAINRSLETVCGD
jgi:Leucine-rich repeat (LRR) protein